MPSQIIKQDLLFYRVLAHKKLDFCEKQWLNNVCIVSYPH